MNPIPEQKSIEKELLRLLNEYYHFVFMTRSIGFFGFGSPKMDLEQFMRWLNSRN